MNYIDNINFLRKNYPALHQRVRLEEQKREAQEREAQAPEKQPKQLIEKGTEKPGEELFCQVEEAKNGEKTLRIHKNGRSLYLHSKYNPSREAESIVEQFQVKENLMQDAPNQSNDLHIIFYGMGLAYHLRLFLQKYPLCAFSIYEPSAEVFYEFIRHQSLQKLPLKQLQHLMLEGDNSVNNRQQSSDFFYSSLLKNNREKTVIFPLPVYEEIFKEKYEDFLENFKQVVKGKRSSLHTNYAFQKRWILNSMINFKEVLNTPNILLNNKGQFKGKPALLVAAGPSLNDEIENIRYIKDKKLAYIFSVGSAVNTLIHHGIYPHAACTYDPTEKNQVVFQKIVEENITGIPLIFGSSVGYETLQNYPGPKIHMITSQDTTSAFYLKPKEGGEVEGVIDAPSIAVITLQLLRQLGFGTVILVGQNLAYRGERNYADGIGYYTGLLSEEAVKKAITVRDVEGREILTSEGFNRMRLQMEMYIKQYEELTVINTTRGGAHIEGTSFRPLQQLLDNVLSEKTVNENWWRMEAHNYDARHLEQQHKLMEKAHANIGARLKGIHVILKKIERLSKGGNFPQVEKMYHKLDRSFNDITNNYYFQAFVIPMNRVYYEMLAEKIASNKLEKNKVKKAEAILNAFDNFLSNCQKDMVQIEEVYIKTKDVIEAFCNSELETGGAISGSTKAACS